MKAQRRAKFRGSQFRTANEEARTRRNNMVELRVPAPAEREYDAIMQTIYDAHQRYRATDADLPVELFKAPSSAPKTTLPTNREPSSGRILLSIAGIAVMLLAPFVLLRALQATLGGPGAVVCAFSVLAACMLVNKRKRRPKVALC
jgi:hypothetical protein